MITFCKNCEKEFKTQKNRILSGRGVFCSNECKYDDTRKRMKGNEYWKKTTSTQFKKGHETLNVARAIRYHSTLYKRWRDKIVERDNNECQQCGNNNKKSLIVHHIVSRKDAPELILSDSNGLTLCRSCHAKLHSFI